MKKICSIEGCSKTEAARGWCANHYKKWRQYNDPLGGYTPAQGPCDVEGCDTKIYARKMCRKHYTKNRKYGDPLAGTSYITDIDVRFNSQTEWHGDCLLWTGSKTQDGYGYMSVYGKPQGVHRYAWEREYGEIPPGRDVDHEKCHNRACCNVAHLRLSTTSENMSNRKGPTKVNRSGFRNVYQIESGRYAVYMQKQGKRYHFGYFDTLQEAAEAASKGRKEVYGEFAGEG